MPAHRERIVERVSNLLARGGYARSQAPLGNAASRSSASRISSTSLISCEAVFEPTEWKSVYRVVLGKSPAKAPKLQEMIRVVAQLGGYVNRRRDDPPGPQTVWLGLQRLHDINLCWLTFGPGTRANGAGLV
jgi:hypothetical protein